MCNSESPADESSLGDHVLTDIHSMQVPGPLYCAQLGVRISEELFVPALAALGRSRRRDAVVGIAPWLWVL